MSPPASIFHSLSSVPSPILLYRPSYLLQMNQIELGNDKENINTDTFTQPKLYQSDETSASSETFASALSLAASHPTQMSNIRVSLIPHCPQIQQTLKTTCY
ncbi:MAG: hypothetical protein EZS28_015657 [Streblomastix strix]|uniref:Uncharacterized protein n=1 Tax=Streblomastix strix TaxID=222440 RepID=A0A5J4W1Q1_9EUKA|nr:MAG: hypothetical protein EZS28_015657 [Streblomastix strix]